MNKVSSRSFLTMMIVCSVAGSALGGVSSWVDSDRCLQSPNPTTQCLTQNPIYKTIQGASVGMVAGIGAAVGATWQATRRG